MCLSRQLDVVLISSRLVTRLNELMTTSNAEAAENIRVSQAANDGIPKARTGIAGFDEITRGELPAGRPTLIVGGPAERARDHSLTAVSR